MSNLGLTFCFGLFFVCLFDAFVEGAEGRDKREDYNNSEVSVVFMIRREAAGALIGKQAGALYYLLC